MSKNETLVSNIRANDKSGMSTVQIFDIPYVGVGYFHKNAVANILSWLKCIKLGMEPDNHKTYEALYYTLVTLLDGFLLVSARVYM